MVQGGALVSHKTFPERRMIGRIYRIDRAGGDRVKRISVEFDAIDELSIDKNIKNLFCSTNTNPFGLIRVVTSVSRFFDFFGFEPFEGAWFSLILSPEDDSAKGTIASMPAWHAQLSQGGYAIQTRGYIKGADFISFDGERGPATLSSAASTKINDHIQWQFSDFGPIDNGGVEALLAELSAVDEIVVHDVGQANFVTMYDVSGVKPIIHYDAGWPVAFNNRTVPPSDPVCQFAPVILSHWDWDHLHGYYRFPDLQAARWIVPVQKLGPGASRVAERLKRAGLLMPFDGAEIILDNLILGVCRGHVGNMNQTGLALRIDLGSPSGALPRGVLLAGDADYENLPDILRREPLYALLITHHGAEFNGEAPLGLPRAENAIVSVGRGNCYKHPSQAALKKHQIKKWNITMTCAVNGRPRGSRQIR